MSIAQHACGGQRMTCMSHFSSACEFQELHLGHKSWQQAQLPVVLLHYPHTNLDLNKNQRGEW